MKQLLYLMSNQAGLTRLDITMRLALSQNTKFWYNKKVTLKCPLIYWGTKFSLQYQAVFWFLDRKSWMALFLEIEVQLIYKIVFVLGIQKNDSIHTHTHTHTKIYSFFELFSIIDYYKTLIQFPVLHSKSLFIYFIFQCVSINSIFRIYPFPALTLS